MLKLNVLTIFPGFFREPLETSIPGRVRAAGLAEYRIVDLRDYTHDRHRTVDDEPFGGGAGMVMKPEPFFEAIDHLEPAGPIVLLTDDLRPGRAVDVNHAGAALDHPGCAVKGDGHEPGGFHRTIGVLVQLIRCLEL